jgi:hypothetical protein
MSAKAPAGSVNKRKGNEATVDRSEIKNGDGVSTFIIQVAAVSWAATQVPEMTAAIHSFRKFGFAKAAQVEEVRRSERRRIDHRLLFAHKLLLTFFLRLQILSIGAVTEEGYSSDATEAVRLEQKRSWIP